MKKIFLILAIVGLIFTSCGSKNKKDSTAAHTHEDGTVHTNDAHKFDTDAKPEQEDFEVETDSVAGHKHESGDEHEHAHDHK